MVEDKEEVVKEEPNIEIVDLSDDTGEILQIWLEKILTL